MLPFSRAQKSIHFQKPTKAYHSRMLPKPTFKKGSHFCARACCAARGLRNAAFFVRGFGAFWNWWFWWLLKRGIFGAFKWRISGLRELVVLVALRGLILPTPKLRPPAGVRVPAVGVRAGGVGSRRACPSRRVPSAPSAVGVRVRLGTLRLGCGTQPLEKNAHALVGSIFALPKYPVNSHTRARENFLGNWVNLWVVIGTSDYHFLTSCGKLLVSVRVGGTHTNTHTEKE